jgi:hypothetical protein
VSSNICSCSSLLLLLYRLGTLKINNNKANTGGGIDAYYGTSIDVIGKDSQLIVSNNYAKSSGAGMKIDNSQIRIKDHANVIIEKNYAEKYSGKIFI